MENKTPNEIAHQLFIDEKFDELNAYLVPYLKANDAWSQVLMGYCYQLGNGVDIDKSVARHYFELAASQGDQQGQLLLGRMLLIDGDLSLGREYLIKAFDQGSKIAAHYISQSYFSESSDPATKIFAEGLVWLKYAAEGGVVDAMHQLGCILGERDDFDSLSEALSWFRKAAGKGYERSALNAGLAYAYGRGTGVNYAKAREYYSIAAEAGLTSAIHNLGVLYCDGKGGDVDKEAAFNCFNASAAQGSFLSSQSISKMFAAGEIRDIEPNPSLELAWLMIADQQAKELGHTESSIIARKKQLIHELSEDEKRGAITTLEVLGETQPRWVSDILAEQYESGDIVWRDLEKSAFWRNQIEVSSLVPEDQAVALTTDTDLSSLPKSTRQLVERLPQLGFSEQQVHGLFVMVGLYAGTPRTVEEIQELYSAIQKVLPHDQSAIINHLVDEFFEEYQLPLEEFCFRSGYDFEFQPIECMKGMEPANLLMLRDHGLLDAEVSGVNKLASASRLFQSFLTALGESTFRQKRSIKEAFLAGVYQMQHMAQLDLHAVQQLSQIISTSSPLVIGHLFTAITRNSIDYTLGCENEQMPLYTLMSGMDTDYAQQLWAFQSHLLFHGESRIEGVADLDPERWHFWVLDRAKAFSEAYPSQLVGLSKSNATLFDLPKWNESVNEFEVCDSFIETAWGFNAKTLRNDMELLEYKALMIHVVYASLTFSRENVQ